MNIIVLHNVVPPDAPPDEQDNLIEARYVADGLEELGHEVRLLPFGFNMAETAALLRAEAPDLVFNLVETIEGASTWSYLASALLEHLGLPYTGGSKDNLYITTNKVLTKQLLRSKRLPTAPWNAKTAPGHLSFPPPYIVKPVWEEASVDIDDHSVFQDGPRAVASLAQKQHRLPGGYFIERFIDGREFNLSVLPTPGGPWVLPPAEIRFLDYPEDKLRLVGYRAKWDDTSFEFHHTVRTFDFPTEDAFLLNRIKDLTRRCCRLLNLAGYVRVDFRVTPCGQPVILEVNSNPCISPDAGFFAAVTRAGLSRAEMLSLICQDAMHRRRMPSRYDFNAVALPARLEIG